jgi:hypothetical protein
MWSRLYWRIVATTKGKAFFTPLLDLREGLYAQVLLWSDSTAVNLDVTNLSVVVEGTRASTQ